MPERGRPPWSGGRPPWWPDGETWPPADWRGGPPWRRRRGRFLWRVALFVAVLVIVAVGGATLLFWLLGAALSPATPGPHAGLVAVIGIVLLVLLVGGIRRAAGPVGDLVEAASRVEAGDYTVRVPERGAREIRGLARAFNQMAERLASDTSRRRALLADVSHELRTPLSVIQGNLEGVQDGVYPADPAHVALLLEETRTLGRLVDDLRTLALAEAGELPLHREQTDIGAVVREAVEAHTRSAQLAGVQIEAAPSGDLPALDLDPIRIREVIGNLVANAIRHTPSAGTVRVTASREDGGVAVAVTDTGEGMPPEVAARIFERFYRDPQSGGSGLGLPIARGLVLSHGGTIGVSSEPGHGTTVRFTLPGPRGA
jgi:two-component system sensor histidine kinase BaeS